MVVVRFFRGLFPDELMVMRRNECLVLVENLNPIRTTKIKWYESPLFEPHGVNLHPKQHETIEQMT
jgi:type IV secretory pathway TraG/TraD family ATPase VirD4